MRQIAIAVFLLLSAPALTLGEEELSKSPQWYLEDIARLTAEGGRWITDNSAYQSENEPFEAYGMEWQSGFDGDTMTGRLFGIKDGQELPHDFWEFRQYWHPGRQEAVIEQFGWGGALGLGTLREDEAGTRSEQTFHMADGTRMHGGHKSRFADPDTYVTESFDIVDGAWEPRRKYVWKRQAMDKE
jgi:hypothetical protein